MKSTYTLLLLFALTGCTDIYDVIPFPTKVRFTVDCLRCGVAHSYKGKSAIYDDGLEITRNTWESETITLKGSIDFHVHITTRIAGRITVKIYRGNKLAVDRIIDSNASSNYIGTYDIKTTVPR